MLHDFDIIHILDVPLIDFFLFKTKGWLSMDDLDVGWDVWKLYDLPYDMMTIKPHVYPLIVISRIPHHMFIYISIPHEVIGMRYRIMWLF